MRQFNLLIKRIIDLFGSLIGIIILSPILIIISLAIKLTSKGLVFFRQERLGRNGKVFKIIKFRTMVDNAEKVGTGIKTYDGDPRITKVGDILRKTSLDELPQLFNVIGGSMSIVGPRPPVPYHPREYRDYPEHQIQRFEVKQGITGYAQVKGRNLLTWDERIKYDVEYVKRQSTFLDFKIIILTIIKVFKKEDIHSENNRKEDAQ